MLRAIVLGAAAGGGLPQWNCACPVCAAVRSGQAGAPQTQSSIVVSADGERWVLINASPDIRQQFAATPALHPRAVRHSPLSAVLVTNADVDHVAGLLSLREAQPFALYATRRVHSVLDANAIFNVVNREHVPRRPVQLNESMPILDAAGEPTGICIETFTVPGKVALWLEDPNAERFGSVAEDTIGVAIRAEGSEARLFYLPGCADVPDSLKARFKPTDTVLFDGTTYTEHEMAEAGVGQKSASRMGHLVMSGPQGTIARLADVPLARRLFIHINNTNPVWLPDSEARREIARQGWDLAFDGMELTL
ncbi:pyrroloquinoline quinone biosynthesis protein PqqB [Rivihabitans pingtungensis]|jgi:pyrroloquinoline quinone biosynthesis protein B|uniref:pyrroloquinoline quinone biosynthesis protein PqqB n=2 Tax=Rivihabitans pingtungensis TaxID=1054498 RepID=UPI002B873FD9|nr:pyrroloquinoline quinone biosynthesis protein PqqB [Rivihabitans pingtungensis]HNX71904.1 pyrroloquinoline quinone biosynthesis protein PqqB [Rivihabitans pingtungensis]